MTIQEAYDKVYTHFILKEQPLAMGSDGSCGYRITINDEVLKCAVGLLIKDSDYFEEMDLDESEYLMGTGIGTLCERHPDILTMIGIEDEPVKVVKFLTDLQAAHDDPDNIDFENTKLNFYNVGNYWGLTIPSLPT